LKIGRFHSTSSRVTVRTFAWGSGNGGGVKLEIVKGIQVKWVTDRTEESAHSFAEKMKRENQERPRLLARKFTVKGSSLLN
jgi:hypothetical protein